MVTWNVDLTEDQNRRLEEIAAERHRSVPELIRESVAELLRIEEQPSRQELKRHAAALSGRFRSGLQNLSVDHDRYLVEDPPR